MMVKLEEIKQTPVCLCRGGSSEGLLLSNDPSFGGAGGAHDALTNSRGARTDGERPFAGAHGRMSSLNLSVSLTRINKIIIEL